jgi:hypothetical protein
MWRAIAPFCAAMEKQYLFQQERMEEEGKAADAGINRMKVEVTRRCAPNPRRAGQRIDRSRKDSNHPDRRIQNQNLILLSITLNNGSLSCISNHNHHSEEFSMNCLGETCYHE